MELSTLAMGVLLAVLPLGCGLGASAPSPTPAYCDGIPADIGSCSESRPAFTGTTCEAHAAEWGQAVDERVQAVIDGPKAVDGKGRSVLLSDVLVLASVLVANRMHTLGLLAECDVPEFLPIARAQFRPGLDDRVLEIIYDGDPATATDWDLLLRRMLTVLDTDELLPSSSPASTT